MIVYFYPAAMTPGCTTEACDFRDNLNSLASAGYQVIGISKDAPAKNKEFQEQEGLNFPLLSDEDLAVHQAYGAYGEKNALRQDGRPASSARPSSSTRTAPCACRCTT